MYNYRNFAFVVGFNPPGLPYNHIIIMIDLMQN